MQKEAMKSTLLTEQRDARRTFVGGSDARIIMGDNEESPRRLWREKRGEVEPEDLSGQPYRPARASDRAPLIGFWYERNTGHAHGTSSAASWASSGAGWMAATLDGIVEPTGAVFEAKFMLPWSFTEEGAAEKHMAQLQHNLSVTNARAVGPLDHHRRWQMGRDHHPGRLASTSTFC